MKKLKNEDSIMTRDDFKQLLQNALAAFKVGKTYTDEEIETKWKFICNNSSVYLDKDIEITEGEKKELLNEILQHVRVEWPKPIGVFDPTTVLEPWFFETVPEEKRYYWNRYKQYLLRVKLWTSAQVKELEDSALKVVNQIGNPRTDNTYCRHGLVIGEVQSGKTTNYASYINMAADAGYEVIIVLAGLSESLRFQTQTRLDKDFAGVKTKKSVGPTTQLDPVGVSIFKNDLSKRPANCTSAEYDFNSALFDGMGFTISGLKVPCYFILKKNKKILENVYKWLHDNNATNGKIQKSLLLIDDESDNASLNTRDEDHDPTAINSCIRKLIGLFDKASYLAITATPFANIFVDPDANDSDHGSDLFPSDYAFNLSKPSNYHGVAEYFGDNGLLNHCVKLIDETELEGTEEAEGILPLSHKKDDELKDLPSDLYEAMRYYLLCNAVLDKDQIKANGLLHRSMMINISRFIKKHDEIKAIVLPWLDGLKADVNNYSGQPELYSDNILSGEFYSLFQCFKEFFPHKDRAYWNELAKNYLSLSIRTVDVVIVNQKKESKEALDFDSATSKGQSSRYIFIGGFGLARGLTLEGLIVSYIYRRTAGYDTLLQMGRWFGYRPGYEELTRIWLNSDMKSEYADLANYVLPELYAEIYEMNRAKLSPKDFGLMIRNDIDSLEITARNKMRHSNEISIPVKITGHLLETPRLINKKTVLEKNNLCVSDFLESALKGRETSPNQYATSGLFWKGVQTADVLKLVNGYSCHPWHLSFQSNTLADYIIQEGYTEWDLYIAGLGKEDPNCPPFSFGRYIINPFSRDISIKNSMLQISNSKIRVGQAGQARVGLTQDQYAEVHEKYKNKKNLSDSMYLDVKDRKPLVIVYPVFIKPEIKAQCPELSDFSVIYAIGLGFPGQLNCSKKSYMANIVKYREMIGEINEEDE